MSCKNSLLIPSPSPQYLWIENKISFPLSSQDISFILVLPYFFAPSRSKLVSQVSSWVRASHSQSCAHPHPPSQPPFGSSPRLGKGGRWIVLQEKGRGGHSFWEGWIISQELILFKLKTVPSSSNLLLSRLGHLHRAASTHALALARTWYSLVPFTYFHYQILSVLLTKYISNLSTLLHRHCHHSDTTGLTFMQIGKRSPFLWADAGADFIPACHLCAACDLPNLAWWSGTLAQAMVPCCNHLPMLPTSSLVPSNPFSTQQWDYF